MVKLEADVTKVLLLYSIKVLLLYFLLLTIMKMGSWLTEDC